MHIHVTKSVITYSQMTTKPSDQQSNILNMCLVARQHGDRLIIINMDDFFHTISSIAHRTPFVI